MIVPDGGKPRRYRIPMLWAKIGAGVIALCILIMLASFFSFAKLITSSMERTHLRAENKRLTDENRRIVKIAQDVEKSKQSLERIIRSLGGKIDYQGEGVAPSPRETVRPGDAIDSEGEAFP